MNIKRICPNILNIKFIIILKVFNEFKTNFYFIFFFLLVKIKVKVNRFEELFDLRTKK